MKACHNYLKMLNWQRLHRYCKCEVNF